MPSLRVVPAVGEIEDSHPGIGPGAEALVAGQAAAAEVEIAGGIARGTSASGSADTSR